MFSVYLLECPLSTHTNLNFLWCLVWGWITLLVRYLVATIRSVALWRLASKVQGFKLEVAQVGAEDDVELPV